MSLLTPAQIASIRGAIKSVTDTFATTPITINHVVEVHDRFNEDRNKIKLVTYAVLGLVEYSDISNVSMLSEEGSEDKYDVKVTLNVDDLIELDMVTETGTGTGLFVHPLITFKDYFELKGVNYLITSADFDGPLEKKDVLLILKGEKTQVKYTVVPPVIPPVIP